MQNRRGVVRSVIAVDARRRRDKAQEKAAAPAPQLVLARNRCIQALAELPDPRQALEVVRSGGKIVGVSWFGGPIQLSIDNMRERSLRYLFPDISTQAHLEHTVHLVASGRVRLQPTIKHVLNGIESVPKAFEITANKGAHCAINPAQVLMRSEGTNSAH